MWLKIHHQNEPNSRRAALPESLNCEKVEGFEVLASHDKTHFLIRARMAGDYGNSVTVCVRQTQDEIIEVFTRIHDAMITAHIFSIDFGVYPDRAPRPAPFVVCPGDDDDYDDSDPFAE